MTSQRDRQRAAARARLEREMAERAAAAQARRKRAAIIGSVSAGAVVVLVLIWVIVANTGGNSHPQAAASASVHPSTCTWLPNPAPVPSGQSPAPANPDLRNVGTPPTIGIPTSGNQVMTINTNQGVIKITLDNAEAPCAAASFAYLAGKHFFDKSICHRLVTDPFQVLQCGDPTGTGAGGPTYSFNHEFLPTGDRPTYTAGQVAMAHPGDPTGQTSDYSDGNGSQFFIIAKDIPDDPSNPGTSVLAADYTVIGTVTTGMDIVNKIVGGGVAGGGGDGKPKLPVNISSVTVGPPTSPAPTPTAPSSAPPATTASPKP